MSTENLSIYLADHHAGSVGALVLLDHLIETFEGKPLDIFFKGLRDDIRADQAELERLIQEIGSDESAIKKASAWIAEKFSRAKTAGTDEDEVGLLNALEGLLLGIAGKASLWRALAAAAENSPSLRGLDYSRLERRAEEQFHLVDSKRLEVAREVFSAR